jgi:hypothetical protein
VSGEPGADLLVTGAKIRGRHLRRGASE